MSICDSLEHLSIQSVSTEERGMETRKRSECGTPVGKTEMAKMSFEQVAEYIGSLRNTISKLQDSKPDISDQLDDCDISASSSIKQ